MAFFWLPLVLITSLMISPLLCSSTRQNAQASPISTIPAYVTKSPPLSPFQGLSPDISPLLPSPGGELHSPTASIPTIPSNPSPPNPDSSFPSEPDFAFPPVGLPVSSAAPRGLLNLVVAVGCVAYLSLQLK